MNRKSVELAIETSSRIGSVVLGFGGKIACEASFSGIMRHSAEIFPVIKEQLDSLGAKPAEIEHLYISNGPGSFTGLRIAATLAKSMYLANFLKIVTVDTLDVIASNAIIAINTGNISKDFPVKEGNDEIVRIGVVLDAKRGQFFIAVYDIIERGGGLEFEKVLQDSLMTASEFLEKFACPQKTIWLLGDGLVYHREKFRACGVEFFNEKHWSPVARNVYLLGRNMSQKKQFADPVDLKPYYLCRPEIRPKIR